MQGNFGHLSASAKKRGRSRIETLANVNVGAVWIFSRSRTITSLNQLQGLPVAVGPERSCSRKVALIARENLHPALERLAIAAATDATNKAGLFHDAGDFPSFRKIDCPTAPTARVSLSNACNRMKVCVLVGGHNLQNT